MPAPPPPMHSRFKPGQSGNPKGVAKVPDDIRKAAKATNHAFIKVACSALQMTCDEMQTKLADKATSGLDVIVIGMVLRAAKTQDFQRANFILDRILGKPKELLEVDIDAQITATARNDGVRQLIEVVPREKLIELVKISQGDTVNVE